jgi:hypothetical protein
VNESGNNGNGISPATDEPAVAQEKQQLRLPMHTSPGNNKASTRNELKSSRSSVTGVPVRTMTSMRYILSPDIIWPRSAGCLA